MHTWYLCPGSNLPSTHWDRHSSKSESGKMNDNMSLHSDRQDYKSLKLHKQQNRSTKHAAYVCSFHGPTTACVSWNSTRICIWYLCPGSVILHTHRDSHSKRRKRSHGRFLHSDRQGYRLQLWTHSVHYMTNSNSMCAPRCTYHLSGSRILCTHWNRNRKPTRTQPSSWVLPLQLCQLSQYYNVAINEEPCTKLVSFPDPTDSTAYVYSIFNDDLSASCACTLGQQPMQHFNRYIHI